MMSAHQIRALYDEHTITVYQAYPKEIASAAVATQKLSASPAFRNRMTWIKPSWCWMMYRCGYSFKDPGQERVLAIKMKHEHFEALLAEAQLAKHGSSRITQARVIVQWDPERGARLEKFDYRSIQIGISKALINRWVGEWIESIEDVTDRAREMARVLAKDPDMDLQALCVAGLMPSERIYTVSKDIMQHLEMEHDILVSEQGNG